MVDGQDITNRLLPYLISVQVIDNIAEFDQCNIELDDRNAELQIPPDKARVQVYMGWASEGPNIPNLGRWSLSGKGKAATVIGQGPIAKTLYEEALERQFGGPGARLVFSGWVDKCESGFGRKGGGRRLWIEAVSSNNKGDAKEVAHQVTGAGNPDDSAAGGATGGAGGGEGETLFDAMTKAFSKSGIKVKFSPEMMKIKRKSWVIHQSPQDFGSAIAQEVGGIFKIADGVATMVGKDEGVNADGIPMITVEAYWGINLIGWRIKPYAGRPQWGSSAARLFDLFNGSHEIIKSAIGGNTPFGGTGAIAHNLHQVADKAVAGQTNEGSSSDSKGRRGTGWVLINGEPEAKAGGHILINYARPGVDGLYQMIEVEHNYTRGVGYTTRANVQWPRPLGGDYKWKRSTDVEEKPPPATEVSPGPEFKPGEFNPPIENLIPGYTAQEIRDMRRWYLDRNMPLPDVLKMTESEKLAWWNWYNERGYQIPNYLKSIEDAPVFVPDIPEL